MELELSIIERLFTNYNGSACCIVEEATSKVLFFNELCKELCPTIEKNMLIDEMYNKISDNFDIVSKGGSTFLIADKEKLFGDHYYLAENNINILDISQTIVQDYFNMMMIVDLSKTEKDFLLVGTELERVGEDIGVIIKAQREDIFDMMHRI